MSEVKNPYSEARKKANKRWDDANLYKVSVSFPKQFENDIKIAAGSDSVAAFIRKTVLDSLQKG